MKNQIQIKLEGSIIDSNFDQFCEELKQFIRGLDKPLETDGDFDLAAKQVKELSATEKGLKEAKENALQQAAEIQQLFEKIDSVSDEARNARLSLSKQIKDRKESLKQEIIDSGGEACIAKNKNLYRQKVLIAIKGKSSLSLIENTVHEVVQSINEQILAARDIIERFKLEHGESLVPDENALEEKDPALIEVELERRVEKLGREKLERDPQQPEPPKVERPVQAQNDVRMFLGDLKNTLRIIYILRDQLNNEKLVHEIKIFGMKLNELTKDL